MGPWAAEVDVEGVAVFFGGEFGGGVAGDGVPKCARFAPESTILVCVFEDLGLRRGLVGRLGVGR